MADFEVHIDLDRRTRPIGLARCNRVRGTETILFEYDDAWLADPDGISLEPALALTRGPFAPASGRAAFGSVGDSAPDTWGRITTPHHELIVVTGKAVMLSRRFDRAGAIRIPFLSAMAMLGAKDGERGSYPEIVDDHLGNHGFLWLGKAGWSLSPAYDLNPVPTDLKACVLTTNIDLDEVTCSVDLLEAGAEFFGLTLPQARAIIKEVATVTATWRDAAKAAGARAAEITRMASAFEHEDLKRGLTF